MRFNKSLMALLCVPFVSSASAQIINAGFEDRFNDWIESDVNEVISTSTLSNTGSLAARIQGTGGRLSQVVSVEPNSTYEISAQLRGAGRLRVELSDDERPTTRVNNGSEYGEISFEFETGEFDEANIVLEYSGSEGRWDDLQLTLVDQDELDDRARAEQFGLNPNSSPWVNFDLSDWALDAPNEDPEDGLSARTSDADFADGELFPGSEEFFYTANDGGMVFKSPVNGARTSSNTSFPRSELREMLRAGDTSIRTAGVSKNNWALGYQPDNPDIGARNGSLKATLRVNQVTSTGDDGQVGRVIIGQIHALSDEPMRLYYRKLPDNELGGIYAAHEIRDGDDTVINLIGSRSRSASNPEDGIALGEVFSYEIINEGALIEVIIRRGDNNGEIIAQTSFDMSEDELNSGYDLEEEWMYFKAGAYTQNNTGDDDDFDLVTFYRLENLHD